MNLDLECHFFWLYHSRVSVKLARILMPPEGKGIWFKGLQDEEEVLKTSKYPRALSMVALKVWADKDGNAAVANLKEIRMSLDEAAKDKDNLNQTTKKLDEAVQEINFNETSNTNRSQTMSEDEIQIIRYFISANELALKFCHSRNDFRIVCEASLLKKKMEAQKFKALVLSMKAEMFGILGDLDSRLVLLKQLDALEPNVLKYRIGLFQAIRGIRREKSHLSVPSDEEIEAIVGAYDLDPESPTVLLNLTAHFQDIYRILTSRATTTPTQSSTQPEIPQVPEKFHYYIFQGFHGEKSFKNFILKMKEFARKAVDKNPDSVEAALREAEIRWCDHQSNLITLQALLDDHVSKWKNSSSVFHKAGKFYCKHFWNDDVWRRRGLRYLEKSILMNRRNFSAFMAYLRYNQQEYSRTIRSYRPLVLKIDEHMEYYEDRNELAARLHFLKAILLTITSHNSDNKICQAVEAWMTGIERLSLAANFRNDVHINNKQIFGGNVLSVGLSPWDFDELQAYLLKKFKERKETQPIPRNLKAFANAVALELIKLSISNPGRVITRPFTEELK